MLQWFLGKINPNYQRREMINRAKFYIQHIKKTYLQGSNVTEINQLEYFTLHISELSKLFQLGTHTYTRREKKETSIWTSVFLYLRSVSHFRRTRYHRLHGTSSLTLTNESRPHKSPKVDNFWQVSAAKVWQINFAIEPPHDAWPTRKRACFLPRSLRFFNPAYLLLFFFLHSQCLPVFP